LYAFTIVARAPHNRIEAYNPAYVAGPVSYSNFVVASAFKFYANEPCVVSYSLYQPAFVMIAVQTLPYTVVWGEPREAGPHTELWQGRSSIAQNLLYGSFNLSIRTQVLPENTIIVSRQANPMIGSFQAECFNITPTDSEISGLRFSLLRNATVTVQMVDPNGNLITVLNQTPTLAGSHTAEWGGTYSGDRLVSLAGDYEAVLVATDPASGIQETRTANVRVRR
jgi:hypothetical protein